MLFAFAVILFCVTIVAALIQRTSAWFRGHSADLHGLNKPSAAILPYSPNTLDTFDMLVILADLLAKHLPGRGKPKLEAAGAGFRLPRLHLGGMLRLARKDYDAFQRALPKSTHEHVPPGAATHPLFLVSATTPLLLVLLSHPASPIRPLGAVNTRNRFLLADAPLCRDATALIAASKASELTFTAGMGGAGGAGRRRRRGVEFDVVIEVLRKGALVMRQEISLLQFLPAAAKPAYAGGDDAPRGDAQLAARGPGVRVAGDAPRRYAACSKDWNPIHTSGLAARLFGFPSAIAHGNHLLALTAQALVPVNDGGAPSAREEKAAQAMLWLDGGSVEMQATFVKPVTPLPLELSMGLGEVAGGTGGEIAFGLSKKDKLCVSGSIRPS